MDTAQSRRPGSQGHNEVRKRYSDGAPGTAGGDRPSLRLSRFAELFKLHHRRNSTDHRRLFRRVTPSSEEAFMAKATKRKYGASTGKDVKGEMHRYKRG